MTHPYNGDDPAADVIRVPFGPRPTETIPLEWATFMLRKLKERNPKMFGDLLTAAIGIERKTRGSST